MIQKLQLLNFRNFSEKVISFSDQTIIVGPNGSGKTNILEALYLLSSSKSLKAQRQEEMIKAGEEIARVKGKVVTEEESQVLEVVLTKGVLAQGDMVQKTPKKRVFLDGVAKRSVDFAGNFKSVLFKPQDMDLIIASPSKRREFLDMVLSQVDREYRRSLGSYEKGLRSRNRVLQQMREFGGSREKLYFWDKLVIKNGEYITNARAEFVDFMNADPTLGDNTYAVTYDKSIISEARIAQYAKEEVFAGTTLVGPHRDDLEFHSEQKDLARFGSRGEQRMGVLWAKLQELNFIEQKSGTRPTLLLDDIFSELDESHREIVKEASAKQQTIMTTADAHYADEFSTLDKIQL